MSASIQSPLAQRGDPVNLVCAGCAERGNRHSESRKGNRQAGGQKYPRPCFLTEKIARAGPRLANDGLIDVEIAAGPDGTGDFSRFAGILLFRKPALLSKPDWMGLYALFMAHRSSDSGELKEPSFGKMWFFQSLSRTRMQCKAGRDVSASHVHCATEATAPRRSKTSHSRERN